MRLFINDMLYALSYALDCVEGELLGVRARHSERVAYMCVKTGREMGMKDQDLSLLAASAVLHDNALTEYISSEARVHRSGVAGEPETRNSEDGKKNFHLHCEIGERNVQILPFYTKIKGAVLCHHENANGSGPFGRLPENTPLFAQLIHIADTIDNVFNLSVLDGAKRGRILQHLEKNRGVLFDGGIVDAFLGAFPAKAMEALQGDEIRTGLIRLLPHTAEEYSDHDVQALSSMFAKITDYKSNFTCKHSIGIAQKARAMGEYYGCDGETCTKLYLAGALHDIGKLAIPTKILEKPDRLTKDEFEIIKKHATYTWNILGEIDGLGEVRDWASFHHEKLNGHGYPFGRTADELNRNERLLGCIDIYQALTEDRPYKKGMSHRDTILIMRDMAWNGFIDGGITEDIENCFSGAMDVL